MPAIRSGRDDRDPTAGRPSATKVPQITLLFWVAKLLTTGMGETTWDYLDQSIGQTIAVAISGVGLVAALVAQLRSPRYNPWVYWTAVVMVSVFGTAVADLVHNDFGVPYTVSTAVLLGAVAAVFALWFAVEKTLSIHTIRTRRREGFYWSAVLLTFALGTAAGDWTAGTLGLRLRAGLQEPRRLHRLPAPQARRRRRPGGDPHRARRRLQPLPGLR
jgi:uncharacterized membrane-anchored protein